MSTRDQDFITEARLQARKLWEAWLWLKGAQEQWNALDYGTSLADGADNNEGITKVQVGAVVFDTANAIKTSVMDIGHATNVANLL